MHKPNVLCNPLCVLSGTLLCTKRHPIIHGNFDLIWFNFILSFFRIFFSFLLFEIGKNGMAAVPGYSTWDPRKQGQIFLFLFFLKLFFTRLVSFIFVYIFNPLKPVCRRSVSGRGSLPGDSVWWRARAPGSRAWCAPALRPGPPSAAASGLVLIFIFNLFGLFCDVGERQISPIITGAVSKSSD